MVEHHYLTILDPYEDRIFTTPVWTPDGRTSGLAGFLDDRPPTEQATQVINPTPTAIPVSNTIAENPDLVITVAENLNVSSVTVGGRFISGLQRIGLSIDSDGNRHVEAEFPPESVIAQMSGPTQLSVRVSMALMAPFMAPLAAPPVEGQTAWAHLLEDGL